MSSDFEAFLKDRERISGAYISGDPEPLEAITTTRDPASFMPPSGTLVSGADAVRQAHREGAKQFASGSEGRFEIIQSGESGDLAFWTGLHHANVHMAGKDAPVPMVLRTTEVFRRENGAWRLVHRHADMAKKPE